MPPSGVVWHPFPLSRRVYLCLFLGEYLVVMLPVIPVFCKANLPMVRGWYIPALVVWNCNKNGVLQETLLADDWKVNCARRLSQEAVVPVTTATFSTNPL